MDKLITKEEAIANCIKRLAVDSTDRLFLEAVFGLVYESGFKDGLRFVEKSFERTEGEKWIRLT